MRSNDIPYSHPSIHSLLGFNRKSGGRNILTIQAVVRIRTRWIDKPVVATLLRKRLHKSHCRFCVLPMPSSESSKYRVPIINRRSSFLLRQRQSKFLIIIKTGKEVDAVDDLSYFAMFHGGDFNSSMLQLMWCELFPYYF